LVLVEWAVSHCLQENPMETVMGVFASRERAEETVKELLDNRVPQDSIVFLTRSESEAMMLQKSLGTLVGGFVGSSAGVTAGVAAAMLFSIPGIGQVFVLGLGATAALGLAGAAVGRALSATSNPSLENATHIPQPTPNGKSTGDLAFLGEILKEGRSLILVRTDSQEVAEDAAGILDRMGISSQWRANEKMQTAVRQIGGISVVDVWGGITFGPNSALLREVVSSLLEKGRKHVLLNLRGVEYIDSAGLGELVRTYTTLQRCGGQFKIVNRNPKVQALFKAIMLHKVFDVHQYEATAIPSFGPLTTEISRYTSIP
jgi:anti-sigma B factor antagonist